MDTTGVVIELNPADRLRWQQGDVDPILALHHAPTILVLLGGNDTDTGLGPGVIAVEEHLCEPSSVEVEMTDERCS